ncbi:MAG: ABC transporter permease [Streptosporangiaceae bacterium]
MSTLAGTGALAKLAGRRDRIMLPAWIYVLTALVAGTAYSFKKLYPTAAGRAEFAAAAGRNPSLVSLYGTLYGNSLGSLTAWRYGGFAALGAGLMSIFIVIRHTRADEETGRLELVGSAAVGRHAALTAGLLIALTANVVLALVMSAALIALGLPAAGSISLALAIAGCGLVFTAVAAVAAQLAQAARSARGLAIGALGVAYLLRAVGDSAGAKGPGWLTWLSPIGWAELIRSFGVIRWWILVLPLVTTLALGIGAGVLAARRDYDAGLLPGRPGPAQAAGSLRSPLALAWRLHRATLISWVIGALIYGVIIGSAAKGITGLLGSAEIRRILVKLGGSAALTNAYLAAIMSFTGLFAAGYAVSAVLRLRSEETDQRADPLLATGVTRISWGLSHLLIAAGGTILILAATGLGTGLGYALRSPGGGRELAALVGAGLAQAPAALVIAGLAVALFGLAPRFCAAGAWTALGIVVLMLFLGASLQLSHWVLDISPFTHTPKLPGGPVSAAPLIWLCVIAGALGAAGLVGLRRRDIG